MKLSKNKIPKLLKSKHQSRKRCRKKKIHSKNGNTFRKRKVTNLRQKTLKRYLKGGTLQQTDLAIQQTKKSIDNFNKKLANTEKIITIVLHTSNRINETPYIASYSSDRYK